MTTVSANAESDSVRELLPAALVTDLKARDAPDETKIVYVLGYAAQGDGGDGWYRWDADSTETDNSTAGIGGVSVIQPTGHTAAGRWLLQSAAATISENLREPSIAALKLRAIPAVDGTVVDVDHYYDIATVTAGGGGGKFQWRASSLATADDGITLLPTGQSAGTAGRWVRLYNSGVIHAAWFGAGAAQTSATNTTAINACVTLLTGVGGVIQLPAGLLKITSLKFNNVQSIELKGVGTCYSQENGYGTTILTDTTSDYLIQVYRCTDVRISSVNLDGKALKATVLDITNLVSGPLNDFNVFENVEFYNVKASGSFVSSSGGAGNDGGEVAVNAFINCTFQLNGAAIPASKGTSLTVSNDNSWNLYFERCNFLGAALNQAILLKAGDITLRDCEFENNTVYDIYKYESAKLSAYNVRSQSPGTFLYITPLVDEGTNWTRKRTVLQNIYHFNALGGSPARSVIDDSGSPLKIDNLEGNGVQINYTGSYSGYSNKEIDITNTLGVIIGVGGTSVDITSFKSQPTAAGYLSRDYDKTLTYSKSTRYDAASNSFITEGPQTVGGVVAAAGQTLVTNGGFDSATTGWTAISGATLASIAGGQSGNSLRITSNGAAYAGAQQQILTGVGRKYRLTAYHKDGTLGSLLRVSTANDASGNVYDSGVLSSAGVWTAKTQVFTATTNSVWVSMLINGGGAADTTLYDTISIKEIPLVVETDLIATGLPVYANNAAAITGGLIVGSFYRTNADPDPVCVVH